MPCHSWDLSSPTRDWTPALGSESVLTTGPTGNSLLCILKTLLIEKFRELYNKHLHILYLESTVVYICPKVYTFFFSYYSYCYFAQLSESNRHHNSLLLLLYFSMVNGNWLLNASPKVKGNLVVHKNQLTVQGWVAVGVASECRAPKSWAKPLRRAGLLPPWSLWTHSFSVDQPHSSLPWPSPLTHPFSLWSPALAPLTSFCPETFLPIWAWNALKEPPGPHIPCS